MVKDYSNICQNIKERLLDFTHPFTAEKIIDRVFFREEIYQGPFIKSAVDIIAHPVDGYDLKDFLNSENIFDNSALNGMHTYGDAFVCSKNIDIRSMKAIQDLYQSILRAVQ